MPHRHIFREADICNFKTIGRGMARIIKSVMTSEMTNPSPAALALSQRSIVATLVHQYSKCVPHWKAAAKKNARVHDVITAHITYE